MQHYVHIRTAVADIDHAVMTDAQPRAQLIEGGDLAITGTDAVDRGDLAGRRIETSLVPWMFSGGTISASADSTTSRGAAETT